MNARRVYMNPDDRQRFQEEVERKGFVRDFEIAYRARDGRRLDCLVTTTVRRDTDGIVIGYQGIIRERKGMEERLYAHHQKLRSLAVGLSTSAERERFRIAADLHDCIGQMLAASQLKVKALRRAGDREREALIAELKELIDQMDCDIRSMTFDLSSPVLYQLGLVPGLEWLGEQVKRQYGLMVDLATEGDCEVLDQDMRFLMFRCIRELLLNVAQHADVDRATVSLRRDEAQLQAMVQDAGRSFDTGCLDRMDGSSGFGLFGIQEHLAHIGGHFEIESTPGKGTRCLLAIPFSPSEQEGDPQ